MQDEAHFDRDHGIEEHVYPVSGIQEPDVRDCQKGHARQLLAVPEWNMTRADHLKPVAGHRVVLDVNVEAAQREVMTGRRIENAKLPEYDRRHEQPEYPTNTRDQCRTLASTQTLLALAHRRSPDLKTAIWLTVRIPGWCAPRPAANQADGLPRRALEYPQRSNPQEYRRSPLCPRR